MADFFFSCENLSVGYNGKPLISEITVGVRHGEILTLIGPNGSGKSTILKSIARQLSLLGGTVSLNGRDLAGLSPKKLAKQLAVVLTERIHPEMMTVEELVASGRYPYTDCFGRLTPDDKRIISESLEAVRASDLCDRDFNSLSDGQRQRVMLARALCQQPEIIILDEPTSFLDIRYKTELLGILRTMAKENGITVVMSLHEIDLASKISDQVMCVKGEKIYRIGTPEEIFSGDIITELYGLKKGEYDAMFGSTELLSPAQGKPDVFIIGGNGCGIPFYRFFRRTGVPFLTGILFENDVDFHAAKTLAAGIVSCPPFSPPSAEAVKKAKEALEECGCAVDCGCPAGEINGANRELLEAAREKGKRILCSVGEAAEVFGGK